MSRSASKPSSCASIPSLRVRKRRDDIFPSRAAAAKARARCTAPHRSRCTAPFRKSAGISTNDTPPDPTRPPTRARVSSLTSHCVPHERLLPSYQFLCKIGFNLELVLSTSKHPESRNIHSVRVHLTSVMCLYMTANRPPVPTHLLFPALLARCAYTPHSHTPFACRPVLVCPHQDIVLLPQHCS